MVKIAAPRREAFMHPWDRSQRTAPGEAITVEHALVDRLAKRDVPEPAPVVQHGERIRPREVRPVVPWGLPRAGPNAPLLKRLVRNPFSLPVFPPRRVACRDALPWDELERAPTHATMATVREMRRFRWGSPLEGHPRPSAHRRPQTRGLLEQWLRDRSTEGGDP